MNRRQCIVSFINDDGFDSDFTKLQPIFSEAGVPWSLAVIAKNFKNKITDEHMAEAKAFGCDFGSHTVDHVHLNKLSDKDIEYQLSESKRYFNEKGYDCDFVVYPFGDHNAKVRKIAKKYYKMGFHGGSAANTSPICTYAINRVSVGAYFDDPKKNDFSYYKSAIDRAYEDKAWIVFALHGSAPEFDTKQQGYLISLIKYIKTFNDIRILNIGTAYASLREFFSDTPMLILHQRVKRCVNKLISMMNSHIR